MNKRTMTLNLSPEEMEALEVFAKRKDMSKTATVRQALRLYHLVDTRLAQGETLFCQDETHHKKIGLLLLR